MITAGDPMATVEFIMLAGVGVVFFLSAIACGLAGVIVFSAKKSIPELKKLVSTLSTALESLNYAEIPIAIIAVIASHTKYALEDVAAEYTKDAARRRSIVLQTFKKDPVSDAFIADYQSKFLQHGYIGEELIT